MILALDLSTPRGALAVVDGEGVVVLASHFKAHRSHNALVFPHLREALVACGKAGPEAVVVGTGPGSYTGTRVAIAAGMGIAMSFGVPLMGMSSAVAAETWDGGSRYLLVGDARRGKYFGMEVDRGLEVGSWGGGVELFDGEGLGEWVSGRRGAEVWTYDPVPPDAGRGVRVTHPDPAVLGRAVAGMGSDERNERAREAVEPIYLSAPFVTEAKPPKVRGGERG